MHQAAAHAILARACELADPAQIEAVYACPLFHHEHHDYTLGTFETSEALDAAVRRQADEYLTRICEPRGITKCRVLDGAAAGALHDYARENAGSRRGRQSRPPRCPRPVRIDVQRHDPRHAMRRPGRAHR